MSQRSAALKSVLEKLYRRYNRRDFIKPDPLQFVYEYSDRRDMEVAAFLAAALAYGRVRQIQKSLSKLFAIMGDSPYRFVLHFNDARRRAFQTFKHRFTTGEDIAELLGLLRRILHGYGSIEGFFCGFLERSDPNVIPALTRFCASLRELYACTYGRPVRPGVSYLLTSPEKGSPCKRLNLFLRWMVREDGVDAGLWRCVDKARLVVPLDVHMGRLCRILGLCPHKSPSMAAAIRVTESFLEIQPADPVKYDFALSRIGILEDCTGRYRSRCELCELFEYCLERDDWTK